MLVVVDVTLILDEPAPVPDIVVEPVLLFEAAADLENVGVPELVFD